MDEPSLIDELVLAFRRTLAEAVSSPRVEVVGDGHATLFDGAGLQFLIAMTFTPPGDERDER